MFNLQKQFVLSDKGYEDLKKAITAVTITNLSLMLPFGLTIQIFVELLKPLMGQEISWTRMWLYFGIGLVSAGLIFLSYKNDYKKTYVASFKESEKTRVWVAEHIRKLPMNFFNSKDLSELTTNLIGDCGTMEHVLSHIIPQLIANFISLSLITLMLMIFDWRLALTIFITVPISFLIIFGSRKFQEKIGERHVKAKLQVSDQVQEYLEGIKVIKACKLDGQNFAALNNALLWMKKMAVRLELAAGVFVTGAQIVLQAGVGLTVFFGTYLLTNGEIELIPLLMFFLIVVRIYGPFLTELTLLPELFYMQVATNRMRKLLSAPIMEGDADTEIEQYQIELENVSFSYSDYQSDEDVVIKDMSMVIPGNGISALVGPSGSGKSTISRLVARFWDVDAGKIRIGGADISQLDPEYLMGYMSFVFQDVVLFNDTVYNNIRIGNMDASEEEVMQAARAACCDEFIQQLPGGYQTLLGENGSTLSGGERQRISIARALLKDAPIVLLDEATASLDPENEVLIQQAISRLIEGKTVIVIAHRLRTVAGADKIFVLNEGRLVEEGTHQQLMDKKGLYEHMFTLQQDSLGWSI
jgi:ATP-binding cassette, subfamily B, bacterial IrtB/YbtQ